MSVSNVASERAVLAGICAYGKDCYLDVEALINENTFTVDYNKIIHKCVAEVFKKTDKIDFVGILSAAGSLGLEEFVSKQDVLKHIHGIINTPVELETVRDHAKKLRRLQYARELQSKIKESYNSLGQITGEETINAIIATVEDPIQELALSYIKEDDTKPKLISHGLDSYIAELKSGKEIKVGIPSGFPTYDESIGGGFLRKSVDVVGARLKVGKSTFCENVALSVSGLGIPVLVLDTEMSSEDHWNRIIANLANVSINEFKFGKFNGDELKVKRIDKAYETISQRPYFYKNVSGADFSTILSYARRWILKEVGFQSNGRTKDCLIIYDYLKLMSSDNLQNVQEFQELGFQMTKLHNFMVEYDAACLTFVQLNRDGIVKETSDVISQSDRIGWLCTSFTILKEKSEEEKVDDGIKFGNRKLVPVVARHGPGMTDDGYICVQMDGEFARMREIGSIRKIKRNKGFESKDPEGESKPQDF